MIKKKRKRRVVAIVKRKNLLVMSKRAVCGVSEREIIVHKSQKSATIRKIRASGFIFVGVGPVGNDRVKIWFSPSIL